jgi:hypothetical protein
MMKRVSKRAYNPESNKNSLHLRFLAIEANQKTFLNPEIRLKKGKTKQTKSVFTTK